MRYTGNLEPLPACRRMGDLLCNTFGDEPGKRDIIKAGRARGSWRPPASWSPWMLLYRLTGEPRYLDFCKYILRAWEHPNGPKIISTLLTAKRVDKVGNGKAYEMLSCLNGALEYYRTTGEPKHPRSLPQRLGGHRPQPALYHRRRQLWRALPRRLRPAQRGQCRRDLRHRHLAAVQRAVAAADRRSRVLPSSSSTSY